MNTIGERRRTVSENGGLDWLVPLLILLAATLKAGAQTSQPVDRVVRVGMTVEDVDRSAAFYTRVLNFERLTDVELSGEPVERLYGVFGARCRTVQLRLGDEVLELVQFLAPRGRAVPRDSRSNDGWFQHVAIVTCDMDRAYARLREHKVGHASAGPQTLPAWNPSAGGIRAFYFRDPDDHVLEVIWFPAGKGDPRWRDRRDLFTGIDHTAIVVEDTQKALRFYRDILGMRVAGESENYGVEQERLNNVFGARLRITGLRAGAGMGVELLEYLAPRDGRAYPADARANDLFHWHTTVAARDVGRLVERAKAYPLVSGGKVEGAALIRDGDGHAVMVLAGKEEMKDRLGEAVK